MGGLTMGIWIVLIICITIVILVLIVTNRSEKKVIKRISLKEKDLAFTRMYDHYNIVIYSDGTHDLEMYNDDDTGDFEHYG